jgi:hypothetical protein
VRVVVNGRTAGMIAGEPNEEDICVEVLGHRRNSHGLLHHAKKWLTWTGPAEFVPEGSDWTDEYQLVPCGLMKPTIVVTRKSAREEAESPHRNASPL